MIFCYYKAPSRLKIRWCVFFCLSVLWCIQMNSNLGESSFICKVPFIYSSAWFRVTLDVQYLFINSSSLFPPIFFGWWWRIKVFSLANYSSAWFPVKEKKLKAKAHQPLNIFMQFLSLSLKMRLQIAAIKNHYSNRNDQSLFLTAFRLRTCSTRRARRHTYSGRLHACWWAPGQSVRVCDGNSLHCVCTADFTRTRPESISVTDTRAQYITLITLASHFSSMKPSSGLTATGCALGRPPTLHHHQQHRSKKVLT